MASKMAYYKILVYYLGILATLHNLVYCASQRKSALGHMVPYEQKSIVVHEIKLAPGPGPKSDEFENDIKQHKSVKRVLTNDDIQGMWMEDFSKDYLYEMQSDSASDNERGTLISPQEAVAQCPPPQKEVPTGGCMIRRCTSDKECSAANQRCCYNGCGFTCMNAMPPPAFVDWQKEPRRRLQSGMSWLVPGPDEQGQVEYCSTSEWDEDEDMLLCPHGFICHIEFPGNPSRGIPNRGQCVQENNDPSQIKDTSTEGRQTFRIKSDTGKDGSCLYSSNLRRNGESFTYHHHLWYFIFELKS